MKRFFYSILILLFFVTLQNCDGDNGALSEEETGMQELLSQKLASTSELIYEADTLLAQTEVLSYYSDQNYTPLWTTNKAMTPQGDSLFFLIENAYEYGLLPEMFHHQKIERYKDSSLVDTEILLTNAFLLFTTHVSVGCIDTAGQSYVWKKDSLEFELNAQLERVKETGDVRSTIEENEPEFWEYQQLKKGLSSFLTTYPLDTNNYEIPAFKEDSVLCYAAAKEALFGHAFIDSTQMETDSLFIEQIKVFQRVNGLKDDAIVGKWTGRALAKSNMDRFYQAAMSMEKWRSREPYPNKYIRVNVPEFTLYFMNNDSLKRKHRVVVGAYTTQTPEFHATMRRMVTNPFWHVPYSISSTEILYNARKDTGYFNKRGYKIFKNGDEVDPTTVDWTTIRQNNFPYRVRQNGGGGNSLGKIKFLFPNIHSVFIHDTPSRSLFWNDVRAYSHGCVRLHEPFELAKSIIAADAYEMIPDTLDSIVRRGEQRVIELNDPFDVYIEYVTATADSSGMIQFHPDIYGRDERVIERTFRSF